MTKGMIAHLPPKERFGYACLVGMLLFGFGYVGARHLRQPAPIVFDHPNPSPRLMNSAAQSLSNSPTPSSSSEVVVHVVGAVARPGVVHLPADSRVVDAIHAAGGATKEADTELINLAAKLVDGSQVSVPTKSEAVASIARMRSSAHEPVEIEKSGSFTPVKIDPAYVAITPTQSPDPPAKPSGWTKKTVGDVDVNTADAQALQSLPGVGPSTAQKIVDFRQEHGAFKSADDLLDVPGIGEKKLEKMRPYVKI